MNVLFPYDYNIYEGKYCLYAHSFILRVVIIIIQSLETPTSSVFIQILCWKHGMVGLGYEATARVTRPFNSRVVQCTRESQL